MKARIPRTKCQMFRRDPSSPVRVRYKEPEQPANCLDEPDDSFAPNAEEEEPVLNLPLHTD